MKSALWHSVAATLVIFVMACTARPDIENDEPGEYWVPPISTDEATIISKLRRDITLHHTNFDAWIPKGWSFSVTHEGADKYGTMLVATPSANLSQELETFVQIMHNPKTVEENLEDIFERLRLREKNLDTRWVQHGKRHWIEEERRYDDDQVELRQWLRRTHVSGRQFLVLAATTTTSAAIHSEALVRMVNALKITDEEQSP